MLGVSLQLKNSEVCSIEIICGITRREIIEILKEVLEELGVKFILSENQFKTETGDILIKDFKKSHFNLRLYRIVFPDEEILKKFRERLISKRAGG